MMRVIGGLELEKRWKEKEEKMECLGKDRDEQPEMEEGKQKGAKEETVRRQCHLASENREKAWGHQKGGHHPSCRTTITSRSQLTPKESPVSAPGIAVLNASKCLLYPFWMAFHSRLCARLKVSQ